MKRRRERTCRTRIQRTVKLEIALTELCHLVNKYGRIICDENLSILPPACGTQWKEILTFPRIVREPD